MLLRHPVQPLLVCLLASVLTAHVAWAAGPGSLPAGTVMENGVLQPSGTCTIAPYSPGNSLTFWGTSDHLESVYQLVRPGDCPTCTGGSLLINSISYRSRTAGDPTCTYPVEVAVVGVVNGACPAPDDSRVLCGPSIVDVTVTSVTSDIVVPLPTDCCISEPAFVRIRWLTTTTCGGSFPQPIHLVGAENCMACTQYFKTLTTVPVVTEACSAYPTGIYLSVDADCCEPTRSLPHSWGRVKQIYR